LGRLKASLPNMSVPRRVCVSECVHRRTLTHTHEDNDVTVNRIQEKKSVNTVRHFCKRSHPCVLLTAVSQISVTVDMFFILISSRQVIKPTN
jgi:hypothetical protein